MSENGNIVMQVLSEHIIHLRAENDELIAQNKKLQNLVDDLRNWNEELTKENERLKEQNSDLNHQIASSYRDLRYYRESTVGRC